VAEATRKSTWNSSSWTDAKLQQLMSKWKSPE
jgi:hypothetical protein